VESSDTQLLSFMKDTRFSAIPSCDAVPPPPVNRFQICLQQKPYRWPLQSSSNVPDQTVASKEYHPQTVPYRSVVSTSAWCAYVYEPSQPDSRAPAHVCSERSTDHLNKPEWSNCHRGRLRRTVIKYASMKKYSWP